MTLLDSKTEPLSGILEIKSNTTYSIGGGKKDGRYYLFRPSDPVYPSFIVFSRIDRIKYRNNVYAIVKFLSWDQTKDKYPRGSCESIIGEIGQFENEVANRLHMRGLARQDLKNTIIAGAIQSIESKLSEEYSRRLNLTSKMIVSIDPPGCRDVDDALHVEQIDDTYILGIHIADVSHWVPVDSIFDHYARKRMTSIYGSQGTLHMLPTELSENWCSLLKGQLRLALSLILTIDSTGQIISSHWLPTTIRNKAQITYDKADDLIRKGDPNLSQLYKVIQLITKSSQEVIKSSQEGTKSSQEVIKSSQGVTGDSMSPAHFIVEKAMILANTMCASYLIKKYGKCLLRTHTEADYTLFSQRSKFLDQKDPMIVNYVDSRSQNAAKYQYHSLDSKESHRHFGLDAEFYTHFTSPIRRYIDLVNHRLIKSIEVEDNQTSLAEVANLSNQKVKRFNKDVAYLHVVETLVDETIAEAYIIGIDTRELFNPARIKIYIPHYQLTQTLLVCHDRLAHLYQVVISPESLKIINRDTNEQIIDYQIYSKITIIMTAIPRKDQFRKKLRICANNSAMDINNVDIEENYCME
jgi:exoribonuclease R